MWYLTDLICIWLGSFDQVDGRWDHEMLLKGVEILSDHSLSINEAHILSNGDGSFRDGEWTSHHYRIVIINNIMKLIQHFSFFTKKVFFPYTLKNRRENLRWRKPLDVFFLHLVISKSEYMLIYKLFFFTQKSEETFFYSTVLHI